MMRGKLHAVPSAAPGAVLYLRQSVARDDSISIELQETAGRDYCAKQGYEVLAVEVDEGLSGRNWSKRPAVQRVMDMIESREADVIVLWKWSRLSRNRKDWALAADRIDVAGGRIESATEPIDTATASGRFARGVMTEYAAFQSEQIGEQWNEVFARRFRLGLPPSGPYPFGWVQAADGGIQQNPEQARAVKHAYGLYMEGVGFSRIAATFEEMGFRAMRGGRWQQAAVRTCLDSPIHAGLVEYKGELKAGAHEGIITTEERDSYLALRGDRTLVKRHRPSVFMLSSLTVCHCGMKRVGKSVQGTTSRLTYYGCSSRDRHTRKSIPTSRVDLAIGAWIKSLPGVVADASYKPAHSKVDADTLAREIVANEKRLVKLTKHLISELIPEAAYAATRDQIQEETLRLEKQHAAAVTRSRNTIHSYMIGHEELADTWDELSMTGKQRIVRTFIRSVTINENDTILVLTAWSDLVLLDT